MVVVLGCCGSACSIWWLSWWYDMVLVFLTGGGGGIGRISGSVLNACWCRGMVKGRLHGGLMEPG